MAAGTALPALRKLPLPVTTQESADLIRTGVDYLQPKRHIGHRTLGVTLHVSPPVSSDQRRDSRFVIQLGSSEA